MSNDEAQATEAWRYLVAEGVINAYVLEGGVNYWLTTFGESELTTQRPSDLFRRSVGYIFRLPMARASGGIAARRPLCAGRWPQVVLNIKRGRQRRWRVNTSASTAQSGANSTNRPRFVNEFTSEFSDY